MEKNKKQIPRHISVCLLAVIIILQLLSGAGHFSYKNKFIQDEYFTYGIANSYYRPFLIGNSLDSKEWNNFNKMMHGSDFKYYICTNKDTAFRYDSVLSNSAKDTTPPVYYLLLHTISSLFPEQFSWWWGFSINCVAFVIEQIFLYLIFREISGSKPLSLMICAFWGFCLGGIFHIVFIRMYTLLNAFLMMYVFFMIRYIKSERTVYLPLLTVITFLGFMTHYLFACFAFFFTGLNCLILLLKKRFKIMFLSGFSVLLAILAAFVIFPSSFDNVFHNTLPYDLRSQGFLYRLHLFFMNILADLTGIKMPKESNLTVIIAVLMPVLFALIIATVSVVFRNEGYTKRFFVSTANRIKRYFSGKDQSLFCIFTASLMYFLYMTKNTSYKTVGDSIDRYFFIIMPFMVGVVLYILYRLGKSVKRNKVLCAIYAVVVCTGVCASCIYSCMGTRINMYVTHEEGNDIGRQLAGKDVIVVGSDIRLMVNYCLMLENADVVFYTLRDYKQYKSKKNSDIYRKFMDDEDSFWVIIDEAEAEGSSEGADSVLKYFIDMSDCQTVYCRSEAMIADHHIVLYEFEEPNHKMINSEAATN